MEVEVRGVSLMVWGEGCRIRIRIYRDFDSEQLDLRCLNDESAFGLGRVYNFTASILFRLPGVLHCYVHDSTSLCKFGQNQATRTLMCCTVSKGSQDEGVMRKTKLYSSILNQHPDFNCMLCPLLKRICIKNDQPGA